MNRLVRVSALALTLAALPVLAGCGGSNPFKPPIDNVHQLPKDTPENDTPQNTMIRFQRAYQYQDVTQYTNLLTADFRYTFSSQTDPDLATQYSNNWGKDDESESAKHLLTGFTNSKGEYEAPASNISISFTGDQYLQDPAHTDSAQYYSYVPVTTVSLDIDIPNATGTVTYNIRARHDFYLVRGDAALLTDATQHADSGHWYIRHWDDLSAPLTGAVLQLAAVNSRVAGASSGSTTSPTTWGAMKGQYFR